MYVKGRHSCCYVHSLLLHINNRLFSLFRCAILKNVRARKFEADLLSSVFLCRHPQHAQIYCVRFLRRTTKPTALDTCSRVASQTPAMAHVQRILCASDFCLLNTFRSPHVLFRVCSGVLHAALSTLKISLFHQNFIRCMLISILLRVCPCPQSTVNWFVL